MDLTNIQEQIKKMPTWVWAAGAGVVLIVVFLFMRGKSSGSTTTGTGQTSDFTSALGGLSDAISNLGQSGGGGGGGSSSGSGNSSSGGSGNSSSGGSGNSGGGTEVVNNPIIPAGSSSVAPIATNPPVTTVLRSVGGTSPVLTPTPVVIDYSTAAGQAQAAAIDAANAAPIVAAAKAAVVTRDAVINNPVSTTAQKATATVAAKKALGASAVATGHAIPTKTSTKAM